MFSEFKQLNHWSWTAITLVLLSFCMFILREPVSKAQQQEQPKKEEIAELLDFRNFSNPKQGTIARNPIDGAEMVYIPEGEFMMGTDKDEIDQIWQKFGWSEGWKQYTKEESPKHRVYVDGFWMYKYEVTVAQYRKFSNETKRQMPPHEPAWGWQDNHPIVFVTYYDAVDYCKWAGVQLPTEVEWEYAARGGNTGLNGKPRYIFVWGNELPKGKGEYGNLADESFKKSFPDYYFFEGYDDGYVYTAPVGSFKPNGFELYDMAGNVWEWCTDWYDENYYQTSPTRNPQGPSSGTWRVFRGSSCVSVPDDVRTVDRGRGNPDGRDAGIGFRGIAQQLPR